MKTIASAIVSFLAAQDVPHIWGVPGESFLSVLDALYESDIPFNNTRHEGAAAIAAEADGKLTCRPGVAMVTRGPGAMNAAHGLHIAQHDRTPMALFVGQIPAEFSGRGAFQEMDYASVFGSVAKAVITLDDPKRIYEMLYHGWTIAMSDNPGPVVFVLPEDKLDMPLDEVIASRVCEKVDLTPVLPSSDELDWVCQEIAAASNPIIILGGSGWNSEQVDAISSFSYAIDIPVAVSFRRQNLFDHFHAHYAGDLGLGCNPKLLERIKQADLVLAIGAEFEEVPSQGYTLFDANRTQKIISVGFRSERDMATPITRKIICHAGSFATSLEVLRVTSPDVLKRKFDGADCHNSWKKWTTPQSLPENDRSSISLSQLMSDLSDILPLDAILTNGAGNYAAWIHRYFSYRRFNTQVAPISGSMGYGLPAGLSAKALHPNQTVVVMAGDGCFQMVSQEMMTAASMGLKIIVLVFNNERYGTIRMHQEKHFPGRISGTELQNPDFPKFAISCGGDGIRVASHREFNIAIQKAMASKRPYLIEVMCDKDQISPTMRISS